MGVQIYLILGTAVIPTVFAVYFWLRLRNVYGAGLKILRETVVELDVKDPYFNGHIKMVEHFSILMAESSRFSLRRKQELKLSIYLAEIGKIRIPDYILTKREKLSEEEKAIVKTHPIIACKMVENIKGLEKIAKIVRAHHERYDGDGYPDNMLGDIIPMESRIISIVDSYVAMISERPYKSALSENEAIEELRKGKGKQFDGELVERFIKILKK